MTLQRVDMDRVARLLGRGAEAMETDVDAAESDDARELGERLRIVRRQRALSLEQVESTSAQEFKAAVLGAYERGERAISVARLRRLARFYGVPVDYLLSEQADASGPGTGLLARAQPSPERLVVDLQCLQHLSSPQDEALQRYVRMIQLQRGDFNGRVLTLRAEDRRALACLLGTQPEELAERLSHASSRGISAPDV
jgi:transcriptional regulator with XRE-family HTH domain